MSSNTRPRIDYHDSEKLGFNKAYYGKTFESSQEFSRFDERFKTRPNRLGEETNPIVDNNKRNQYNHTDISRTIPTIKGKSWWLFLSHIVRGIVIIDCKMFYHQKNESKQ